MRTILFNYFVQAFNLTNCSFQFLDLRAKRLRRPLLSHEENFDSVCLFANAYSPNGSSDPNEISHVHPLDHWDLCWPGKSGIRFPEKKKKSEKPDFWATVAILDAIFSGIITDINKIMREVFLNIISFRTSPFSRLNSENCRTRYNFSENYEITTFWRRKIKLSPIAPRV